MFEMLIITAVLLAPAAGAAVVADFLERTSRK